MLIFEQIVVEKGLRSQPFSDQTLREMAIAFPKSKCTYDIEFEASANTSRSSF